MTTAPVLTDSDYRAIQTGLQHIVLTREELQKAQQAGLDVDNELANLDAMQFKLESIKRSFFPNRP